MTGWRYAGKVIDLHTHSTFSDGSDSPTVLARRAAEIGLNAIALTDHDTTDSHEEMATACAEHGIELVPGVEISLKDTEFRRSRADGSTEIAGVHVLAYFLPLDAQHPLQQKLTQLRSDRDGRNHALVLRLQELGFERVTYELVESFAGNPHNIGRPHFAAAMHDQHPEIVGAPSPENTGRLFVDWLGNSGQAYIPKSEMTIEDFVGAAAGTSTFFSIAHPLVSYVPGATDNEISVQMPRIIGSLRERGFRGVEAHYGGSSPETRSLMVRLTRNEGLIPTGGSDYHGSFKPDVDLGRGRSGSLHVEDSVLEEMKRAVA